jgi:eukaryotic-like serine/threonine-protein kinase
MEGMPAEGAGLPVVGAEIAGKYRVESVIGQGGMGTVYAARNLMTGKRVAIKWLLPEHAGSTTRERLLREAQIASSIDHPNVVDIYDVGEHEGGLFLVMEFLRGKPLSEILAERGRMDPNELIALLVPAMRGVHAAHLAGVIHRDLKPENIILSESDGQIVPKVVDFGVSKLVGASGVPNSSLTRTGALVGTPHYMALEQIDGSNAIDPRTDVYAFGVLLYRALTGHFPFDGTNLGEVILKIGTREPAPMRLMRPELPPGLDSVVLRALSRDRELRFKDVDEFARALIQFNGARLTDSMDAFTPGAVQYRPNTGASQHNLDPDTKGHIPARATPMVASGRRRRRVLLIGAAVALALLVGGVVLTRSESSAHAVRKGEQPTRAEALSSKPTMPAATPAQAAGSAQALAPAPVAPPEARGLEAPELNDSAAQPDAQVTAAASSPDKNLRARTDKRLANDRLKQPRAPVAPARKGPTPAPAMIPGERTNGFSVDEF